MCTYKKRRTDASASAFNCSPTLSRVETVELFGEKPIYRLFRIVDISKKKNAIPQLLQIVGFSNKSIFAPFRTVDISSHLKVDLFDTRFDSVESSV
ncbi:hypothetical protein Y032_0102g3449 [Ancylostoma ceylanicum]|uniref:Uncharacterized protein n=1 Tax=Ancylostoma ceylanicum TaxID=53326 RepID=A0A016THB1_9BILA|nr:hypothetical protein Y032_0102g3449 [Ancylostoma ceylanicum]